APRPSPLIAPTTHQPVTLPCAGATPSRLRIIHEDGTIAEMSPERAANGYVLPQIGQPGYNPIESTSDRGLALAVAPERCVTTTDLTGEDRAWGLAVQAPGLRSPGECGIGDIAGVVDLER